MFEGALWFADKAGYWRNSQEIEADYSFLFFFSFSFLLFNAFVFWSNKTDHSTTWTWYASLWMACDFESMIAAALLTLTRYFVGEPSGEKAQG